MNSFLNDLERIDLTGLRLVKKRTSPASFIVQQQIQLDEDEITLVCFSDINKDTVLKILMPEEMYDWLIVDPRNGSMKFFDEFVYSYDFTPQQLQQKQSIEDAYEGMYE
jgi:hypothetical protein